MNSKLALLSLYYKTDEVAEGARRLVEMGYDIIASRGSAAFLAEKGIPAENVAIVVGGDPILGHRVVTLSREVSAALLARYGNVEDEAELNSKGIRIIDLVWVDPYPIDEEIAREESTLESVTEMTDVGAMLLLHAGAKGRRIIIGRPEDREAILAWIEAGMPNEDVMRIKMAERAEFIAADYIGTSADFLDNEGYLLAEEAGIDWEALLPPYGETAQDDECRE